MSAAPTSARAVGHVVGAGDDEAGFVDGGEDEVGEGRDGLLLDEAARHRGGAPGVGQPRGMRH